MANFPQVIIESIQSEQGQSILPELIALLQDAVASGASVGFLPPLSMEEAEEYWQGILGDLSPQSRVLLVAYQDGNIVGSVQLEFAGRANGLHRAEVQKLFVLQSHRRRGIAQKLMQSIEGVAREHQRTLLVLDTREGDSAEQLYRKIGYIAAGVIPAYARNAAGELDTTVYFYKPL
jgi:acetyltransferase